MAKRSHQTLSELERAVPSIRALLRHLVVDEATVEDVLQETRLTALRNPPASGHNLGAWLRVVARNLALQGRRREAARRRREVGAARPEALPSTGSAAARLEAHRRVLECVQALGEPQRTLIVGRYFDGASAVQLAEQHGISRATVDRRLEEARARLREMLAPGGHPDVRRWPIVLLVLGREAGPVRTASLSGTPLLALIGGLTVTAKTALLLLIAVAGLLAVLLVSGQERRAAPEVADRPLARSTPPAPTNHKKPLLSVPRQVLARRPPAPVPMADRWLRVVDEDGQPIRDARVHSVPPKAHHVSREGRWTGRSDEAGRVALPGGMPDSAAGGMPDSAAGGMPDSAAGGMPGSVPRAGEVLLVRHPGYQPLTVEESLLQGAPGREVEVVLKSGYRVAGRVEDPWGKPIAGARVLARLPGAVAPESVLNALPGPGMAARYRETTADEQGRFAFGGLTSLPVSLAARKRYFICGLRPDHNVREPREDLLLVMEPQARVGIRALDAATRLPIAQFGARAAREARGRGYRPSVLELPREDVPATGLSRSGSEFWLTFCLTQAASTARGQSIPILVEAWGYRQTTVELPLSYPGDGDFTQPREVYLEPLPARDATGNVLFDISCPALGRGPGQVWISLASSLLDLPANVDRPRDSRFKARSSRLLWLKDGRASVELPAGTYEAMLGGPLVPHPSDWKPFTVREDKTTNVQMSLPGSIVRIRAYGPGREVIPYFSVGANWKSGGAYRSHVTLQRGETLEEEARSYGVKPGELALPLAPRRDVLIHVLVPGYKVWTEMRHIEAGACLEIEAHLERDEQK